MTTIRFQIIVLATIIIANGCSPLNTATRRTGQMVRMITIDAPLRAVDSLSEAVGRMDSTGIGLSSQAQFEGDAGSGGNTTAKVIDRQFK